MKGQLYTGITSDGSVRIFVAITTDMVQKARDIHNATPLATAAMGRIISATAIMGCDVKDDGHQVSLEFQGDGVLKKVMAVSWKPAYIKAYVANPNAVLPAREDGKIDVGGGIGKGYVTVIKDLGLKNPFIGRSEIVTGEIAEDLAVYFMKSEQQPSVVSLGVGFDKKTASVSGAGGIFIQPLPNASDEVLTKIEHDISNLLPISQLISSGKSAEQIMRLALGSFDINIIGQRELVYECDCSKNRIKKALIALGEKEIDDMIKEDGQAQIHCHFCNSNYIFDKDELIDIKNGFSVH